MSTFGSIIARNGVMATLYTSAGSGSDSKCFIEPIMSRGNEMRWQEEVPLGERNMARYYAFFPPEAAMDSCEYLVCCGKKYDVLRAEIYRVPDGPSHWEAVLRTRAEDDNE